MPEPSNAVQDLDLPEVVRRHVIEGWGISTLHPPQAEAMPAALHGRNLLLSIPTASGKSLVAFLAIARKLLVEEPGSRAIYIVPLKALASEKVDELRELGEAIGLVVGMAIGDANREMQKISDADIIVCTSEKLDSLCRSRPDVISGTSIVIADEIHLVNDRSRGPTMEVNLARLRLHHPKAQIIALSATVGNPEKLALWLDAELVQSEWRPVALEHATLAEKWLEVRHRISREQSDPLPPPRQLEGPKTHIAWCALNDTISEQAQMLIFVSTRRSAEAEARKLSERSAAALVGDPERMKRLAALADELQKENDSAISDRLAAAVRKGGIAFHHAGLTHAQRKAVEGAFRDGTLFCISATPTLAAGVNLPARRVLVRDLKRWDNGITTWISTMEVRQMMGRAGRPQYDPKGESWLVCKGEDPLLEADAVAQRYIHGPPEPIISKLAAEPPLRMHLLSVIATGGLNDRTSIRRFFNATFLSCTQASTLIDERIDNTLGWLVEEGFIRRTGLDESIEVPIDEEEEKWDDEIPVWANSAVEILGADIAKHQPVISVERRVKAGGLGFERADGIESEFVQQVRSHELSQMTYEATRFGHRVSQLYLDPMSATILRDGLRKALTRLTDGEGLSCFALMHLVSATPDFLVIWAKRSKDDLFVKTAMESNHFLRNEPLEDVLLALTQSAWTMERWIEEDGVRSIEKEMKVAPGDLRTRIELMEWLLYSAGQIVLNDEEVPVEGMPKVVDLVAFIDALKQRINHGCKAELLPLVSIRNIGRARARDLMDLGLQNPAEILELTEVDRSRLLAIRGWGPRVLERIIKDVRRIKKS
ncbi:MAG: DEAD/DEAH box helicase [Candidatus Poseidoniaceae archaeon]|nr:DEAD/DEAH box helicase [Candidatus Poseidoniaceae archaeon]